MKWDTNRFVPFGDMVAAIERRNKRGGSLNRVPPCPVQGCFEDAIGLVDGELSLSQWLLQRFSAPYGLCPAHEPLKAAYRKRGRRVYRGLSRKWWSYAAEGRENR